jgi:hypothetical protein
VGNSERKRSGRSTSKRRRGRTQVPSGPVFQETRHLAPRLLPTQLRHKKGDHALELQMHLQIPGMKISSRFTRFAAGTHRFSCLPARNFHQHFVPGSAPGLFSTCKPPPPTRLMSSPSAQSSCTDCTDFFHYTSGRWLWDEEQQLRDRFSPFNVPELQKVAASSVGANKCVEITKLAEGSFNKTFKLTMDNGMNVIARIPHPIAGPRYYMTASEVATMEFVRIMPLPLTGSLDWSSLIVMTGTQRSRYSNSARVCLEFRCE